MQTCALLGTALATDDLMSRRDRYLQSGPVGFGDIELLALILGDVALLDLSARVLEKYRNLSTIARAPPQELAQIPGMGPAKAVRIHAALEAGRRSLVEGIASYKPVLSSEEAYSLFAPRMMKLADEELHALYVDRRRRPLAIRMLTRGTDGFTIVDPKQVFRLAVRLSAAGIILAHNHPSGDPSPSPQDEDVTNRVCSAGRLLGIPLLDHLVIGDNAYTSFADRGALANCQQLPSWVAG